MAECFTCPQGHHWEADAGAGDNPTPACPFCGDPAETLLPLPVGRRTHKPSGASAVADDTLLRPTAPAPETTSRRGLGT